MIVLLVCSAFLRSATAIEEVELWDDSTSFWTAGSYITMTYDYDVFQSGSLSVKVVINGGTSWIYHNYGSNQDFSGLTDYWLHFWWYGNGSTANVYCSFTNSTQTGHRYYYFYDTPKGWTEHRIQLSNMYNSGLDWSLVYYLFFGSLDNLNTFRVDNVHLVTEDTDDEDLTDQIQGIMFGELWFLPFLLIGLLCIVIVKLEKYAVAIVIPALLVLEALYYTNNSASGSMIWAMVSSLVLIFFVASIAVLDK